MAYNPIGLRCLDPVPFPLDFRHASIANEVHAS